MVTRLQYPGSNKHPGGLSVSLSTPLSHLLKPTLVKCEERSDDVLLLCAVVYRAHPGGPETRLPPSTLGGSPAAHPPIPEAGTSSLLRAVPEVARRAASSSAGKHGNDGVPGGSGRQNLRRSARDKNKTSPVKQTETSGDDVLRLSSVVSGTHPGGPEMRLPQRTEGLIKQEVKAEDGPVSTSGDQEIDDDVIVLSDGDGDQGPQDEPAGSDSDSEDDEAQEDSDSDYELEDGNEENSQQSLPAARRTRAASGGGSSANGGTQGGSPAAPPPTPGANASSLSRGTREVVMRAATSTGKRKQPDGEEGGPSCVGRQHLRRTAQRKGHTAAITDLPVNEDSQRRQRNTTRDIDNANKKGCECGRVRQPNLGLPGGIGKKDARWCSQCPSKPGNAVDVVHKRCECGRHKPTFGLPRSIGRKAARWCSQCPSKPINAVDVVNKQCECGSRQPSFGLPETSGMKDARWCSQCPSKPDNAVDVRNKRCECGSHIPIFGLPGASSRKDRRWCSKCPSKPDNAVDVVHKQCECGSHRPSFGLRGAGGKKGAPRWCSQCPSKPINATLVYS